MAERFVVMGSNSFSGGSFVDFLLERGCEVIGISRSSQPPRFFPPFATASASDRYRFCQFDLNDDLDAIMNVVDEFQPRVVVNFAAQSMVAESWQHPDHWMMTNVVSTVRFHERLRQAAYLERYVHVSTPEVYGDCTGDIREDAPYKPSTPYAVSRAAADMSLLTFHRNYRFPVVFTRAANVFGPGQPFYRIIPRTILFIRLGRKLQLHGGGRSVRSFIHIRDVCDGTLRIARSGKPPEIFHLATARQLSVRECVEWICNRMSVPFDDAVEVVGERPGKDSAYRLDSSKARTQLEWRDEISFEQGVDETIQWIDANLDAIKQHPLDYTHRP